LTGASRQRRASGEHTADNAHESLRRMIIDGTLAAGSVINQVTIADELGVSRTPIREAIRRLQAEGLVEAQPQKKARVTRFQAAHCEALYTARILLEGISAAYTADRADEKLIRKLERMLDKLDSPYTTSAWRDEHERFHLALTEGVDIQIVSDIRNYINRTDMYRVMTVNDLELWTRIPRDHREIVEAFRERDGPAARGLLATHLARGAVLLTSLLAPGYDLAVLRSALVSMGGDVGALKGPSASTPEGGADERL
jgi:DNA-binding GntR family transcriptional regulator